MSIYIARLLPHLSFGSFHGQRDSDHFEHAQHLVYCYLLLLLIMRLDNWQ